MSRQAEIRERLKAFGPHSLRAVSMRPMGTDAVIRREWKGDEGCKHIQMLASVHIQAADPEESWPLAQAFAAAPADIRYLLDRLEKAEGLLNEAMSLTCPVCEACSRAANSDATTAGFMYCKCPTHRAIESFLKESA